PNVARPGNRREALHPRRHHRQGRAGRADVAGGAAARRLAGGPVPRESGGGPRGDAETQLARGRCAVNRQHVQTFLWLRWRLLVNQLRRGGVANVVVVVLLAVGALGLSASLFVAAFLIGLLLLPTASPPVLLYVWDGLVVGFLFAWMTGLLVEL